MQKPLWHTLYFGIGVGIVFGLILKVGVMPFDLGLFTSSIDKASQFLHLGGSDATYFTTILPILVLLAILIAIYHTGKVLFDSGEYGIYALGFGFFGGLTLMIGLFGIVSLIGIILIIIGVVIAYRVERDAPGTPEYGKNK